jgi:hypothetical protein
MLSLHGLFNNNNINMKNNLRIALLMVAMLTMIIACKQAGEQSTAESTNEKLNQEDIKASVKEAVFPLPEPMEVYQMLENIGANYVGNILNPAESIEGYYASNIKAVNLGVYAADLSYATVYEKKEAVDKYTKILKVLIDDLGIKIDYKKLMSEDTKAFVQNSDSLIKLTTEVFYDTYEFLYKESDASLAALMVNGYYIEGLYIATHISKDTYDNAEMVKIIYSQSESLKNIIELNKKFEENQYLETLQTALLKLKALYDATDGSLTKEQLDSLTATIKTIRNSVVSE